MNRQLSMHKRFTANFIAFGYGQIVSLAVQFATVPFFLHVWGTERYTEWLVLSGIPVMLGLLDFGVAHATASKATMLAGKENVHGVRVSLQTGMLFSLATAILIMACVLCAERLFEWASLLKLSSLTNAEAQTVLLFLAGHLCVGMFSGPLTAWFMAINHTAWGVFLLANRRMMDVVVTVAALSTGANALQLAGAMLTSQALFVALVTLYAIRRSPWPIIGFRHASWTELRSILKPSISHAGITSGQAFMLQAGLQFLNQVAPASTVVLYSMGRTLMRVVLQIGATSERALRPELSRLKGSGGHAAAKLLQRRIITLSLAVSFVAYSVLVALGPSIMKIWSSSEVVATHWELAALGAHALLNTLWIVPGSMLLATNRHGPVAFSYLLGCVVAVIFLYFTSTAIAKISTAALFLCLPEIFAILRIACTAALDQLKPSGVH